RMGALQLYEDQGLRGVSTRGIPEVLADQVRGTWGIVPGSPAYRLAAGEPLVEIPDIRIEDNRLARLLGQHGMRTVLFVPLRKDGSTLGHIAAYRDEIRSFASNHVRLLENFAAQAVIAMENAR